MLRKRLGGAALACFACVTSAQPNPDQIPWDMGDGSKSEAVIELMGTPALINGLALVQHKFVIFTRDPQPSSMRMLHFGALCDPQTAKGLKLLLFSEDLSYKVGGKWVGDSKTTHKEPVEAPVDQLPSLKSQLVEVCKRWTNRAQVRQ